MDIVIWSKSVEPSTHWKGHVISKNLFDDKVCCSLGLVCKLIKDDVEESISVQVELFTFGERGSLI